MLLIYTRFYLFLLASYFATSISSCSNTPHSVTVRTAALAIQRSLDVPEESLKLLP